ncbi:MAG: hypothetical protein P8104_13000, partial [Gammaproteobacteria bacterium]
CNSLADIYGSSVEQISEKMDQLGALEGKLSIYEFAQIFDVLSDETRGDKVASESIFHHDEDLYWKLSPDLIHAMNQFIYNAKLNSKLSDEFESKLPDLIKCFLPISRMSLLSFEHAISCINDMTRHQCSEASIKKMINFLPKAKTTLIQSIAEKMAQGLSSDEEIDQIIKSKKLPTTDKTNPMNRKKQAQAWFSKMNTSA